MPNIQRCTLQIDEQNFHQQSVLAKPSVTLQHLKRLVLHCASNSESLILMRLVLPSLHILSVVSVASDVVLEIEKSILTIGHRRLRSSQNQRFGLYLYPSKPPECQNAWFEMSECVYAFFL